MAKRETNDVGFEDEHKRFMDHYAVLCTNDFSDPENSDPKPMAALEGEASRDIEELAFGRPGRSSIPGRHYKYDLDRDWHLRHHRDKRECYRHGKPDESRFGRSDGKRAI